MMRRVLLAGAVALLAGTASAQVTQPITVTGSVSANDCVKFVSRTVVASAGTTCGGTGAPSTAHYYTNQAEAGLSAEVVPAANVITLLGSADNAAMRTNLGLAIGTNVQAFDTDLTTWAGVTPGSGIATALAINTGSAGAPVLFNGAGGTPSSLTGTNVTGVPIATGITGTTANLATALTDEGAGFANAIATPSGTNLLAFFTDETGTGVPVFSVSPALTGTTTASNLTVLNGGVFTATNQALINSAGLRQASAAIAGWSSATDNSTASDLTLRRDAAATLAFGATDAASPVAQNITVQDVVAGTSNTAGVPLTINGSAGTGTGAGGSIIFKTAPAGSTGTSQNAEVAAVTIDSIGNVATASTLDLHGATASTLDCTGGNCSVEGNQFYRVGGTDVPVADGGTGVSATVVTDLKLVAQATGVDYTAGVSIPWDSEVADPANLHSGSGTTITSPAVGTYADLACNVTLTSVATTDTVTLEILEGGVRLAGVAYIPGIASPQLEVSYVARAVGTPGTTTYACRLTTSADTSINIGATSHFTSHFYN